MRIKDARMARTPSHQRPNYTPIERLAIVERAIRSLKSECTRRILIPLRQSDLQFELGLYFAWFNEFRPHQGIKGKTPVELYSGISRAPPKFNLRDPKLKLDLHVKVCLAFDSLDLRFRNARHGVASCFQKGVKKEKKVFDMPTSKWYYF